MPNFVSLRSLARFGKAPAYRMKYALYYVHLQSVNCHLREKKIIPFNLLGYRCLIADFFALTRKLKSVLSADQSQLI